MARYIEQVSSVWCLYKVVFLITTGTTVNFVQKQFNKNFSPSKYYRKWEVKITETEHEEEVQRKRPEIILADSTKSTLEADVAVLKTDNI